MADRDSTEDNTAVHYGTVKLPTQTQTNQNGTAGGAAIRAGIQAGNINISDSHAEMMDLTDSTFQAQEEHAELLRRYEAERRSSKVYVPTDPQDVIDKLRSLGEPITLFGERVGDRRERLRLLLARQAVDRELSGDSAISQAVLDAQKAAQMADSLRETPMSRDQIVHTPARVNLIEAREKIGQYSFEQAQARLASAREIANNKDTLQKIDDDALDLYKHLKHMRATLTQVAGDRTISSCHISSDGQAVASGCWTGHVNIWKADSADKLATLRGHTERVCDVAFSPQSQLADQLLSAVQDGDIQMSSTDNTKSIVDLASGSADCTAKLWCSASSECKATLKGHTNRLAKLAWHPSGSFLATTSFDCTWRLWDVETCSELLLQDGHAHEVYPIGFHPDGSLVATGDLGGAGRVWDLRSGKSVMELRGHVTQLMSLDFSPNGTHLATGSEDHTCRIWDIRQRKTIYTIPAHNAMISQVRFAPISGEYLVTASYDGSIRIWSGRDWSPLNSIDGHDNKITCLDIFPDERHFVSCAFDRTLKWWAHEREF